MTENHPITPPPKLLQQWATEYWGNPGESIGEGEKYIAIQAARWGADIELEACMEWLNNTDVDDSQEAAKDLRAARRPKPTSLAEQALAEIQQMEGAMYSADLGCDFTATRAALERLQELEQSND